MNPEPMPQNQSISQNAHKPVIHDKVTHSSLNSRSDDTGLGFVNTLARDSGYEDFTREKKGKKRPAVGDRSNSSRDTGNNEADRKEGPKRASQACLTCRRRKLRCLGGWPCKRCVDSKSVCDFGRPGVGRLGNTRADEGVAWAAYARLQQLESNVANLLAGMSQGSSTLDNVGGSAAGELMRMLERQDGRPTRGPEVSSSPSLAPHHEQHPEQSHPSDQWGSSSVPAFPQPRSQNLVRFDMNPVQHGISPDNPSQGTFESSPSGLSLPRPSPLSTPSVINITEPALKPDRAREIQKGKGQQAEERLATATEGVFGAPFKALAYQPSTWELREASRRNSPERTAPPSRDEPASTGVYDRRYGKTKDDPINTGIIDAGTAEALFEFFMDHCHPFLPVIDVTLDDAFKHIRKSPALISAITAIAARFYNRYCNRTQHHSATLLDSSTPSKLVNLAEFHLAQTLLRKQHTLSDVQAILLLAAWCLVGEGGGPDAWLVTGHAVRVARRLGVHTALARARETAKSTKPGTPEWTALEQFMPQWRTWLAWLGFDSLFSLGFGRPQSTHLENLDESCFLHVHLSQPLPRPGSMRSVSLYGDIYLAGQVQLTHIGRDLRTWGEILADPDQALLNDPTNRERDMGAARMFQELNGRLDEWSRLWVWSGSPYAIYLGSSVRISSLQAEHMRLCLNSYALKYSPDEDDFIAQCLKKAFNAAVSTIQAHYESSQTDFALSFATDYLTITAGQAALFLIRMTKASPSVQNVVSLDSGVITHYLKMAIELLEAGDLSETRLSTFLARTIRDISRVANIPGMGGTTTEHGDKGIAVSSSTTVLPTRDVDDGEDQVVVPNEMTDRASLTMSASTNLIDDISGNGIFSSNDSMYPFGFESDGFMGYNGAGGFDIENFLQLEAHSDLESLLRLSGDPGAVPFNFPDQASASGVQAGVDQIGRGVMGPDHEQNDYRIVAETPISNGFGFGAGPLGNTESMSFSNGGSEGWQDPSRRD